MIGDLLMLGGLLTVFLLEVEIMHMVSGWNDMESQRDYWQEIARLYRRKADYERRRYDEAMRASRAQEVSKENE